MFNSEFTLKNGKEVTVNAEKSFDVISEETTIVKQVIEIKSWNILIVAAVSQAPGDDDSKYELWLSAVDATTKEIKAKLFYEIPDLDVYELISMSLFVSSDPIESSSERDSGVRSISAIISSGNFYFARFNVYNNLNTNEDELSSDQEGANSVKIEFVWCTNDFDKYMQAGLEGDLRIFYIDDRPHLVRCSSEVDQYADHIVPESPVLI